MPAAIPAVFAAVATLATGALERNEAKKLRKQQAAENERQRTEAKEAAKLSDVRDDTGAKVRFGTTDKKKSSTTKKSTGTGVAGSLSNVVGGLGSANSASARLGL